MSDPETAKAVAELADHFEAIGQLMDENSELVTTAMIHAMHNLDSAVTDLWVKHNSYSEKYHG